MSIEGPVNIGNIKNHLRNVGLSLTPPKKGSPRKITKCPINFKPEGPLAHQSKDYKTPEEKPTSQNEQLQLEEIHVIKEICRQTIFQARELIQTNFTENQYKELIQAIKPYTLSAVIEGFEALQMGLCPGEDTVQQFANHFKKSILITIATNLNDFYDKFLERVKRNPSEPDVTTWIK